MNIVKIDTQTNKHIIGRLSDGSDRQEIEIITYYATVEDNGIQTILEFNNEPTTSEIINKYISQKYPNLTLKQLKILQIKQECQNKIYAGFDSTVKYGELKHYTLKDYEQSNMQALLINIIAGLQQVPWRPSDIIVCEIYSAQEFQELCRQAIEFATNQRYRSDIVELYLTNEDLSEAEINDAHLDMELPKVYEDMLIEKLTIMGMSLWP